jgi:hypothetical protein
VANSNELWFMLLSLEFDIANHLKELTTPTTDELQLPDTINDNIGTASYLKKIAECIIHFLSQHPELTRATSLLNNNNSIKDTAWSKLLLRLDEVSLAAVNAI